MGKLVEESIIPALRGRVPVLRDEDHKDLVIVPLPEVGSHPGNVLVIFEAEDESGDAMLSAYICRVPGPRRTAVALRIAELNCRFKFVTFSMDHDGEVAIDVCVELGCGGDLQSMVGIAFGRLLVAIEQGFGAIVEDAFPQRTAKKRSKVEKEVESILKGVEI